MHWIAAEAGLQQCRGWTVGDYFKLTYANRPGSFKHRFYSSYPGDPKSSLFKPTDFFVDVFAKYQVAELAWATCSDRQNSVMEFIAARVQTGDVSFWTNLSRNDDMWATKCDDNEDACVKI